MTVRDVISVLPTAKEFAIAWNGLAYPYNPRDELHAMAFGGFVVKEIVPCDKEGQFELLIAAVPRTE